MNYLVDTNVLTHPTRESPVPEVVEWFHNNQSRLYTSVVVLGEIVYGIQKLPLNSKRRRELEAWLQKTARIMEGRILSVNPRVAEEWGRLTREMEIKGHPMPVVDCLLAATARRYQLAIATRNTGDFAHTSLRLVNPFERQP
jgi:hypothetical protein